MPSIVRCPNCGKATVGVGSRDSVRRSCARCGHPLAVEKLSVSDPEALKALVRERLHAGRSPARGRRFRT